MTQGPAINLSGLDIQLFGAGALGSIRAFPPVLVGRADEGGEERVRLHRLRFELGMELAAEHPGVVREFADLDVDLVGGLAGEAEAMFGEDRLKFAVEFEAVAMALADEGRVVGLAGERTVGEFTR